MKNPKPNHSHKQPLCTKVTKRQLVGLGAVTLLAPVWIKPVVSTVILPVHGQTSCETDMTVGGPLSGNAHGADNCQAACEAEAESLNAMLCEVRETSTGNDTDCACDIDIN